MRNVWLVAKHEILTTIGKKSFWFMTFFFPLLIMAFSLFPSLFRGTWWSRLSRSQAPQACRR